MAQDENGIPITGDNKRRTVDLLPRYFRTTANKKFLSSTLDQLMQPGVVEKVDGFVGRKTAKAHESTDIYLDDITADRKNYQLEPVTVLEDTLGNTTFYRDYRDFINSAKIRKANTLDHNKINSQEYYAWNPHINWDKFVNFREYYWLPMGPSSIPVYGSSIEVTSTFDVQKVDNVDNFAYRFFENGSSNPTITLYRGQTYTFDLDTPDMPMSIRTSRTNEEGEDLYDIGVTGQGTEKGQLTIKVDLESPNYLYYINDNDIEASGLIVIKDIIDATSINVEEEIVNKKTYKMQNGHELSNGMKVEFKGNVTPEKYATGRWYVEGVGSAIKLINEQDLILNTDYLLDISVEFDNQGFSQLPFDNASSYAIEKDYITISKASKDLNQWTRYNNWTHKSVIETTAIINDTPAELDQNYRATRPIIEFNAGLKLYNFGTQAKDSVDLIDTITTDVFSDIEGQTGYFVDGVELVNGMRILVTSDPDSRVNGKIYLVKFINFNGSNQITLVETEDSAPLENETVFIKNGEKYKGKVFYYDGTTWKLGQDKTKLNQSPKFDLYNDAGNSFGSYEASTFTGNKVFSYKEGTGSNDTELGFPLSYRTIENSGDIVFDFNMLSDTFSYENISNVVTESTDTGLLRQYQDRTSFSTKSGWQKAPNKSKQFVIQQPKVATRTNNFIIDVFDNSGLLNDLEIRIYVNNTRKKELIDYEIDNINGYAHVRFYKNLTPGDKLVIKSYSLTPKNNRGYYEFPMNLEKNPLNENVESFTLGEVLDHVGSIVDNIENFDGVFPGSSNLNDIGNVSQYGTKFVQHSGPINLAIYNLTDKDYDSIKAIRSAGLDYIKFKREFLRIANELGYEGETKTHVDLVLKNLTDTKTIDDPYYFSDMVPFGSDTKTIHNIEDQTQTVFSLARGIDFTELNEKAVLPYLNSKLLILNNDYSVTTDGFLTLSIPVKAGDVLTVYEFQTTDGCWIPPTPTKLGLYPKYCPEVLLDDTYINVPTEVSGPYKVYGVENNDQKTHNGKLGWFYPLFTNEEDAKAYDIAKGGTGAVHEHMFNKCNTVFYMPLSSQNHATFDDNSFQQWPGAVAMIQGHDGSLWSTYGDYRDELLLDIEKRIFNNIKQTYDTTIVDIADFVETKTRKTGHTRYDTAKILIQDFNRWLETVGSPDYSTNTKFDRTNSFTYNYSSFAYKDETSTPGSWRAIYKDFYNTDRPHSHPWEILGFTEKPSWFDDVYGTAPYTKNNLILWQDLANGVIKAPGEKIVYANKFKNADIFKNIPVDDRGNLLSPVEAGVALKGVDNTFSDQFKFGDESVVETAWRRSSHYPFALISARAISQPAQFFGIAFDRSRIKRNTAGEIVYSETSKRLKLSDLIFPNSASDDARVFTSGIVNYIQGFLSANQLVQFTNYQTNIKNLQNKLGVKIGGFTEKGKFRLILDSRTPTNEGNVFVPDENYKVALTKSIPMNVYSYSGMIIEIVPEGFIIRGYDKDNPTFNIYNVVRKNNDRLVNIGGTSEEFLTWDAGKTYEVGQIVESGGFYYRVKIGHQSNDGFDLDNFQRLDSLPIEGGANAYFSKNFDTREVVEIPYGTLFREIQDVVDVIRGYGKYLEEAGFVFETFNQTIEEVEDWSLSAREFMFWTTQNWDSGTVLTISPSAREIRFEQANSVVDDIYDNFYDYSLLKADGKRLLADFASTERDTTNKFGIFVKNTEDGIYHLKVPTVQYEHAIVIDNKTVFNDVIYNRPQGYRQERIKVKGYRSDEWNGSYNIPGFIFDDAIIYEWIAYQDYAIGTLVQYKQFYYVAKTKVVGKQNFNAKEWILLNEKPVQRLYPNLDYKANQFLDFYDLDSDNFDTEQQRLAQHLTGYQKRKYLENIINDDVSQYKFYQGAIQDKGTKNVLTKLFDKLGSANKDSLEFFEEWAVRTGMYGAASGDDQFDIAINEEKFRLSPQTFELVDAIDPQDTSLIYRLDRNGIYVKSKNYDHKPFPTKYFNEENSYTKTAGYVNQVDVHLAILNYKDITTKNLSDIPNGKYVWTALEKNQQTWGVYKHITSEFKITNVTSTSNGKFTITVNRNASSLNVGDVIGLNDLDDDTNGFYEITNVDLNKITLSTEGESTEIEDAKGYITNFINVRIKKLDDTNLLIQKTGLQNNDQIWVDDDDTGKWTVIKNNNVFELKPDIVNTTAGLIDSTEKDFGANISVNSTNTYLAVSAPNDLNGSVYIFYRPSDNTDYKFLQQIDELSGFFDIQGGFGTDVALSPDQKYLAVGTPNASNVKSNFVGDYLNTTDYTTGDIVLHKAQLWRARKNLSGDLVQKFPSVSSAQQSISNDYDAVEGYPEIPFMVRGNYSIPDDITSHILIRAEKEQFEGTKVNDVLTLKWNRYTTITPTGIDPFNGDPILNENFINGDHTIVAKVEAILHIQSALAIPAVGSQVVTDTAKAKVSYVRVNDDNEMVLYLEDLNGDFEQTGTVQQNNILVGDYERQLIITDDYYAGWWVIPVGTVFSSDELTDTNPNLVVTDIKLQNEVRDNNEFYNILDTIQNRNPNVPTRPSEFGVLSHTQGQTLIDVIDSKWWFRTTADMNLSVGDQTKFWLNENYFNGNRQDPEPVLGLSFDYLNRKTHTVADIWDGWLEVRLTNFDLQGNPFIPLIGDELIDSATGETAEIAWIERSFATAKIFLKNKSGEWSFGSDFNQPSNAQFVQNDSTLRTIGPINSCNLQNSISGGLIVVDTGTNIPIPNANFLNDLEYWSYNETTVNGILEVREQPSALNLDWTRVYNIPASLGGTSSGNSSEGSFAIYEKKGNTYLLVNYYTVPNSSSNRKLGAQLKFVQKDTNSYRLFVLAEGDSTELNQGRIYFFDKNSNEDWSIGIEPKYRGEHSNTLPYFEGEYVKFGEQVYEASTNVTASAFNPAQWTVINKGIDLLGYVPNDTNFSISESTLEQNFLEQIGEEFDTSKNGDVLITTARYLNVNDSSVPNRKVVVYKISNDQFVYTQLLEPFNLVEEYGSSISISDDGKKIAVGAPYNSDLVLNGGCVYIYTLTDSVYSLTQKLTPKDTKVNTRFGSKIDFDGNTLAITSAGGDIVTETVFDTATTTFDNATTAFTVTDNDSGLISIYEKLNNTLIYGEDFTYNRNTEDFGSIVNVKDNHIYVGLPKQSYTINNVSDKGVVAEYRKPKQRTTWGIERSPVLPANLDKFKGVFLYDKKTNNIISYLDYIDPIQGKIAGIAEAELSFKTSYDPAKYSNVSSTSNITAHELDYTAEAWVGKLWWDIDSARFINHHQGNITESSNNFNKLFPGTAVQICEWVESKDKPSQWDSKSGTEAGLRANISGTSLYGDDAYSTRRRYDNATGTFTTYYYFWVKNKATLPNVVGRDVTALDVQRLIENPVDTNLRFVSILGNNRFALHNCESLIKDNDVAISFNWWTIENQEQNKHIEYKLISDGLETSLPNSVIENKWIDSLVGFDQQDRPVPDINLPIKQRYGALNDPRQSWFVNKTEARKQFIERSNKILKQNLIVDESDLRGLSDFDPLPTQATGLYDTTSETFAEIRFVSIAKVRPAVLDLEIENGNIINVLITDAGQGYINPPTYEITDNLGSNGELNLILDNEGKISDVEIINKGINYSSSAKITIRPFAVLVKNDETISNKWSVYHYINNDWQRRFTQNYDVNLYWEYEDWYATGYNQFTLINYTIDQSYQLLGLGDSIGDVVKINNVGSGGWLLLKKEAEENTNDYSINYKTIGRQDGTIKLLDSLYDVSSQNLAYDGASYDKIFYDTEPVVEFRKIIEVLKKNVFVDNLQRYWNQLFFASLRYVFTEQLNVDWAFKTSFVKAKHNIGELQQKITYRNDNLSSYQNYVEEMKPYKSKIREYLTSYQKTDPANNVVTDFDLAPFYNDIDGKIVPQSVQVVDNQIVSGRSDIANYPSKHWLDNVGFELLEISIANSGSGYLVPPVLKITGGGGSGAEAVAFIGDGKITAVKVTKQGSGYLSRPTVEIIGSQEDDGTEARLSPVLGNGKVKSAHIRVKFDRTSGTYLFQTLEETETFTSSPNQLSIDLKWPIQLKSTNITVTIDGLESLRSEYSFDNIVDTSKGYTRSYGKITFSTALEAGKTVVITYNKAPELLQAQDRINLYYNPTTGMYGNELGQILDGVDYGGVEVTSFDFGGGSGWDSDGWFTSTYDTFDAEYEDEVFRVSDDSTAVLNFASPLETGIVYNLYKNGVRLDDPNYGTDDQTNSNAVLASITGAGQTGLVLQDDNVEITDPNIIVIDDDAVKFTEGDLLVVRKETSDGAFLPDPRSYDSIISGGDLAFKTARGINPEEIIIDGDGFVTPTTSKGPEEQVPGQILDAVDIRVFHRPEAGGSLLSSNTYLGDGATNKFKFGILPQNEDGLFVKINGVLLEKDAYEVDYRLTTVTLTNVPALNQEVNIVSISTNGQDLLEEGTFTGDGCTVSYVTKARYDSDLDYYVTVDGKQVESVLVESNDEDPKAQIDFGQAPSNLSRIQYAIYSKKDSFSKIETTEFTGDGSTKAFELAKTPYSTIPNSHNVIVKQGNKILNPGFNQQFDVQTSKREYFLEIWQTPVGTFDANDIFVTLNGEEIDIAVQYNIRPANSSIILEPGIGKDGDILEVYVQTDGEYAFGSLQTVNNQVSWVDSGSTIQLTNAPADGEKLTVYTFNKHDSMDFERINYDIVARQQIVVGTEDDIQFNHIRSGLVKLRYTAVDAQYVWLTINGVLQTPSIDYTLTADKNYLRYKGRFNDDDAIEIIQFSATGEITPKFGFSQFKDILNRNIYKRLGDVSSYKLAQPLRTLDKEIHIDDATNLSAPDKNSKIPGIIFVNGERIEYLIKQGNTLRQIQRGTLGTGVPTEHEVGSDVYNASVIQTAPYMDNTIIDEITGDASTSTFALGFTPRSVNEFEVFVGGKRLRKNAIDAFDYTKDQDSPEADVTLPAEYSVDGTSPSVTLLNTPGDGIKIQIVRKQGTIWTDTPGVSLTDSESLIARFFKAEKVELPK